MASEIRIKRSGVTAAPSSLKSGELAYSYAAGANKLYYGYGDDGSGNATSIVIIGGQYFTDMLDHTAGTLTASSAIIVDANKKIDDLLVDNLELNGNTLSTTNANGNLILSPNGTGLVSIAGAYTLPRVDGTAGYVLTTNGTGTVSWAASSSMLSVKSDSATTQEINLLTESLTLDGIGAISTDSETANTVKISVATATSSVLGVASFNSTDFTVTAGAVTINNVNLGTQTTGNYVATVGVTAGTGLSVTGTGEGAAVVLAGVDATTTTKGVASFSATDFTVTSGAVSLNAESIQDIVGAMVSTNTESGISVTYDDTNGKLDFNVNDPVITIAGDVDGSATMTDLGNTTITVTLDTVNSNTGQFGSSTAVPVITVNGKGLVTAVSTANISTSFTLAADSGTADTFNNGSTLTFTGTDPVQTAVSNDTITISVDNATTTTKGIASFASGDFTVTSGAVSLSSTVVKSVTTDSGALTPSSNSISILGGEGIDVTHVGAVITVASEDATTTNKGVASFDTNSFSVTAGAVAIKTGGISNTQLANSSVTIGSTTVSLGGTSTSLAGLTEVTIDNLNFNGNTISSTDTNGNIILSPNGTGVVDVAGSRIEGVSTPVNDTDAANKLYVDTVVAQGLHVQDGVDAATTTTLAALSGGTITYNNGTAGVGATLSTTGSFTTGNPFDGVVVALNPTMDPQGGGRILVKNETNQAWNGIYYLINATTLKRDPLFDSDPEIEGGDFVFVVGGTLNAGTGWVQSATVNVIGTDPIVWVQFSGAGTYTAGNGLTLTGTVFDIGAGDGITVGADTVSLASTVAGNGLTYSSGVLAVGGTTNRITVSADAIDIASTYVGQTSITTLGTVTTGTWSADTIVVGKGGTGLTTVTARAVVYGNGTSAMGVTGVSSVDGSFLREDSTGNPYWSNVIDGGTF